MARIKLKTLQETTLTKQRADKDSKVIVLTKNNDNVNKQDLQLEGMVIQQSVLFLQKVICKLPILNSLLTLSKKLKQYNVPLMQSFPVVLQETTYSVFKLPKKILFSFMFQKKIYCLQSNSGVFKFNKNLLPLVQKFFQKEQDEVSPSTKILMFDNQSQNIKLFGSFQSDDAVLEIAEEYSLPNLYTLLECYEYSFQNQQDLLISINNTLGSKITNYFSNTDLLFISLLVDEIVPLQTDYYIENEIPFTVRYILKLIKDQQLSKYSQFVPQQLKDVVIQKFTELENTVGQLYQNNKVSIVNSEEDAIKMQFQQVAQLLLSIKNNKQITMEQMAETILYLNE